MPTLTTIPSGAQGYYAAQSDIESVFGPANVAMWSQLDPTQSTPDTSRVQAALDNADAQVNAFFRDGPYIVPLADAADAPITTHWAAVLAGAWLYFSRGLRDDNRDGDKLSTQQLAVYADMALYKSGIKRLAAARRWPTPSSPAAAE
jgi:phage gp36-like protein